MNRSRSSKGFTLVELLVVIAIIGVLIGMLLPAVQSVREAARRTECLNNMRQLGLSLHNYESAHQAFPPSRLAPDDQRIPSDQTANPRGAETAFQSWTTLLLPFIEQGNLSSEFDFNSAWFASGQNSAVAATPLAIYKCPSTPNPDDSDPFHSVGAAAGDYGSINEVKEKVYTDVLEIADPGENARLGLLAKFVKNPISRVRDGTSNTLYVAECAGQPEIHVAGRRMTSEDYAIYRRNDDKVAELDGQFVAVDGTGWADPDCGFSINGSTPDGLDKNGPKMINAINVSEAYSFHPGGANFAMADGSTHFINDSIDAKTFAGLCTRAGGEVNGDF